jgi:hypothetical protein
VSTVAASRPTRRRRKRPFGVTVIALMQGIASPTTGISWVLNDSPFGISRAYEKTGDYLVVAFGVLGFAIAIGLWRLKRWAWVSTMVWFGFTMAGSLIAWAQDDPQYLLMVISIITVFYLNQRDVQQAFGARPPGEATGVEPRPDAVRGDHGAAG